MPETAIKQVKYCMFCTTDIQIDWHPIIFRLNREWRRIICRVGVTKVIPARTSPLRHRIGFVTTTTTIFVGHIEPISSICQRRFACVARLIFRQFRQSVRKVFFVNHRNFTVFPVNDWEWFAPVTLTAEQPITDLIINSCLTQFSFGKPCNHFFNSVFLVQSVKKSRIYVDSVFGPCLLLHIDFGFQNLDNRQIKFLGKLPVACIVSGNGHNRTCSVTHQYIVGNPDRNQRSVYRIFGVTAREYACFLFRQFCSIQVRLH